MGASACVLLLGCSGATNNPSPTQSAAGSAPTAMHGADAGSAQGSPSGAGSAAVEQAGSGNTSGDSTTGGVSAVAGGASASASGAANAGSAGLADTRDFSHGSRLLIPQHALDFAVPIGTSGNFPDLDSVDNIDATTSAILADGPSFPRQFEVDLGMSYLSLNTSDANTTYSQRCPYLRGTFEVASVAVKQDVGGSGAHLSIEQTDGHYLLTHDGPGQHQVRVTGTFRATNDTDQSCPLLPMGAVEIPIASTTNVTIRRLGSLMAARPSSCATPPIMLSGRNFPGTRMTLLDDQGQSFYPANVYTDHPVDITVETEKPAQIVEDESGLTQGGIIVTGEPQLVRLSTAYGTLFSYQLADTSLIDGWDVKWISSGAQYIKSPEYALDMSVTPAVASGKELAALATLKVSGVPVCSPILATDFKTTMLAPSVCDLQYEFDNFVPGIPGFVATFLDPAGTCRLELSVPEANGGQGLVTSLSTILVPAMD